MMNSLNDNFNYSKYLKLNNSEHVFFYEDNFAFVIYDSEMSGRSSVRSINCISWLNSNASPI